METVNYGRNKLYDTGPWFGITKTTYEILTIIILVVVPYLKSNHAIFSGTIVAKTPLKYDKKL
jgi:hypothetical protein